MKFSRKLNRITTLAYDFRLNKSITRVNDKYTGTLRRLRNSERMDRIQKILDLDRIVFILCVLGIVYAIKGVL